MDREQMSHEDYEKIIYDIHDFIRHKGITPHLAVELLFTYLSYLISNNPKLSNDDIKIFYIKAAAHCIEYRNFDEKDKSK